jgi:hypothetical protein
LEVSFFYAHSSKNMKRGYDVERVYIKWKKKHRI